MMSRFSIGFKNFHLLHILDQIILTLIYNNLIVANEEVALSTLPKKIKSRKNPISADEGVSSAKENLREIASNYHSNPSRTNKVKLAACICALDNAYSDAEVAFINGEIHELSYLHINHQHSAAWKTVKELYLGKVASHQ